MKRISILLGFVFASLFVSANAQEINVLGWCDNGDLELLAGFEAETGVRVNFKEYEGTGAALALLEQSRPGDWDVFVLDSVEIPRVAEAGILAPLNPDDYPWDDFFEATRQKELHYQDGVLYAVPEKFGYNTLAFNHERVDPADMRDLNMLWDEKYQGKITIYDYYIPAMELVAISLGLRPDEVSAETLPQIREKLLELKDNSASVAGIVGAQTALATGEVDIIMAGGEFATAALRAENPALDWVLPDDGGIRWQQAIGVVADSEKQDLATQFVQYVVSSEGQGHLATSECFWAMPANSQALLDDEEKAALRWDEQEGFLANSYPYFIPDAELDAMMLDIWTEMLQY